MKRQRDEICRRVPPRVKNIVLNNKYSIPVVVANPALNERHFFLQAESEKESTRQALKRTGMPDKRAEEYLNRWDSGKIGSNRQRR